MPSQSPVYYYTTCAWCHCRRAVRGTYVWTAAPAERLLARRRRWEKKIPSQFVFELQSLSSYGWNTYTCIQLTAKETTGRREPINPHRYIPDTNYIIRPTSIAAAACVAKHLVAGMNNSRYYNVHTTIHVYYNTCTVYGGQSQLQCSCRYYAYYARHCLRVSD